MFRFFAIMSNAMSLEYPWRLHCFTLQRCSNESSFRKGFHLLKNSIFYLTVAGSSYHWFEGGVINCSMSSNAISGNFWLLVDGFTHDMS